MAQASGKSAFGFEDLEVYKAARALRNRVDKLAAALPTDEKYGLVAQMRRAGVSVTNNIAEGHGRYNWQDNTRFCRQARGSVCEIADDINVCLDRGYAKAEHLDDLKADATKVMRLLNGYIAYLQKQRRKDRD